MSRTVIAHLDMDAFYASVELLRRPGLRGKPVIVSGDGPRAVVTTATYEARKFGVGSAMPTRRARRLCPDAVLIPPDFTAYREASKHVWEIVRRHVELVEQCGIDEGYLDVTDHVAPKASLRKLVSEIRAATGLGASVGIGPNKLVAKVASDAEKPQGFVALSREMACERFPDASPGLIPGIGPKTVERLTARGITTLGALRETTEDELAGLRRLASFHGSHQARPSRATPSRSPASGPSTSTSATGPSSRPSSPRWPRRCASGCRRPGGAGGRSGSRSGSTTGPRSRAPAR